MDQRGGIDLGQLKQIFPGLIPGRCALFLTDAFSGGPLCGVPVGLYARFRLVTSIVVPPPGGEASLSDGPEPTPTLADDGSYLLGVLATDHVGYASWDLVPLYRRLDLLLKTIAPRTKKPPSVVLDSLTIRLAGPLAKEIEALDPTQIISDA